jgi:hypothetical protein
VALLERREWRIESTGWLGRAARGNRTVTIAYSPYYEDGQMLDVLTDYAIYGSAEGKVNYADRKPRAVTFYGIVPNGECGTTTLHEARRPDSHPIVHSVVYGANLPLPSSTPADRAANR